MAGFAPLLAGIAGGSASTFLLYPLDLVKVRMQVNEDAVSLLPRKEIREAVAANAAQGTADARTTRAETGAPTVSVTRNGKQIGSGSTAFGVDRMLQRRKTIMCTIRGVIRHEGFLGLYQGLTPALIGSSAAWGGYFFLYEGIKKHMVKRKGTKRNSFYFARRENLDGQNFETATKYDMTKDMHVDEEMDIDTNETKLGPLENFSAACLAGAAMVVFTNPIWLIKTRMQLQIKKIAMSHKGIKRPYSGMVDAARTIVRDEGPLALYKGAVPAMLLVSHGGVQFVSYEFLKGHFGTYTKAARESSANERNSIIDRLEDSLGYLTMGGISKIIASTTTYPLQVIKARLQQRSQAVEISNEGEVLVSKRDYKGVIDCTRQILRREGIYGFFKGNIPNAVRVAPSAAITFVVYESVMDLFRERN